MRRKKAASAPARGRSQKAKIKGNVHHLPQAPALDKLAEHAEAIRALGKQTMENIVEIGRRLTECRATLKQNGEWCAWLKNEFDWSDQTARRFIHAHEQLPGLNKLLSRKFPISALYLLAAPSTPEEARTEIIERVEAGEPVSVAEVKQTIAAQRAAVGVEDEVEDEQQAEVRQPEVREIDPPVEVEAEQQPAEVREPEVRKSDLSVAERARMIVSILVDLAKSDDDDAKVDLLGAVIDVLRAKRGSDSLQLVRQGIALIEAALEQINTHAKPN
jgi:hypothetical protein